MGVAVLADQHAQGVERHGVAVLALDVRGLGIPAELPACPALYVFEHGIFP
jgi:hypothetical protein